MVKEEELEGAVAGSGGEEQIGEGGGGIIKNRKIDCVLGRRLKRDNIYSEGGGVSNGKVNRVYGAPLKNRKYIHKLALTRYFLTSRLLCTHQSSICPPRPASSLRLFQYYCMPIVQYTILPSDLLFVWFTPYYIGNGNIV